MDKSASEKWAIKESELNDNVLLLYDAWIYQDMHSFDHHLNLCATLRKEMLECEKSAQADPNHQGF